MKTIDLHQVDAFTNKIFGGNPAGVVTNADGLTDEQMKNIAREMNLSETAFVLEPKGSEVDFALRYFTPTTEVKFCGHATIATLYALAKANRYSLGASGKNGVRIQTGAGLFDMSVTNDSNSAEISFSVELPILQIYHLQGKQFSDEFGIGNIVDQDATIYVEEKPQKFVFIPVKSLDLLRELHYDVNHIKKRFSDTNTIIFCFYTKETVGRISDLHVRSFGPLIGLIEDPFTGAIQAGLMLAAKHNSYINTDKRVIKTEQGHSLGRPGFAKVVHDTQKNTATIAANAVKVFSTQMEI